MKDLTLKAAGMFLVLALAFASPSFADENEVMSLKKEVEMLNKKLESMESKLGQVERMASKPAVAHAGHMAPSAQSSGGLAHLTQDIEMGGYLDVQWNNNFRQPLTAAGATATSVGRIFDSNDGSFSVNAFELWLEKPVEEVGDAGFRVDLTWGSDTMVVASDGDADPVGLQQAYIQYIAPTPFGDSEILPDSITIHAGRFATLAGLEVIEGPDNWNISRSFAFGLAIPFIHDGVRTNFGLFDDFFDVYVGINNGWDVPLDNNSFKTLEFAVGYEPIENVSFFHTIYWGGEKSGTPSGKRFLNTNVITWDATDKLSFMGEINIGNENNVFASSQDGQWYSYTGYARYQFTDKFAMAARFEYFNDDDVFRTLGTGTAGPAFAADNLFEQTYTAEYVVAENLIARAEFRHDSANDDGVFTSAKSSQTSIGAQLLYLI